jgi:hypothetical protein
MQLSGLGPTLWWKEPDEEEVAQGEEGEEEDMNGEIDHVNGHAAVEQMHVDA